MYIPFRLSVGNSFQLVTNLHLSSKSFSQDILVDSLILRLDDASGEEGVLQPVVELQLLVRPQHEHLLEELQGGRQLTQVPRPLTLPGVGMLMKVWM